MTNSDEDQQRYLYPPERIEGYLLKDSPAPWRRCGIFGTQAQMRFVVISDGRVFWSASDTVDSAGLPVEMLGVIDLVLNDCELVDDGGSAFLLLPKDGKWTHGDFTGASRGRVFRFDATPSAVTKRAWMAVLQEHIKYAAVSRSSSPLEPDLPPPACSEGSFALAEAPPSVTFEAPAKQAPDPIIPIPVEMPRKTGDVQDKAKVVRCFAGPCQCLCGKIPATQAKKRG